MISNVFNNMFLVGVERIDEQHLVILNLTNNLNDEIVGKNNPSKITELLKALVDFTYTHFQYEESLMDQYPEYSISVEHKDAHRKTREKMLSIIEIANTGGSIDGTEIMLFLREWLSDHILKIDRDFGNFLNSKGVK